MNPANCGLNTQVRLVPSLVAQSQTLVVQPLSPNTRPLSEQDLYVLQRTVIPAGQLWLYTLNGVNQPPCQVQVQMWTTPTLTPREPIDSAQVAMPLPMIVSDEDMALLASMSGYIADDEATGSDMTAQIYGD